MTRKSILAAMLTSAACTSSAFAGFTVSATKAATSGGLDRWDIVAINTGGGTGTQIKGLEYFYNGAPAQFQVDDTDEDGAPDTVNLLSTSRTRFRVSSTAFDNVFVGVVPTHGAAQPNPYTAGASAFSGAIANLGTTQASGTGFQIARIFLPSGQSGVLSGNLGGDIGSKVPFSVALPTTICHCGQPVIVNNNASTSAVFGSVVTGGTPFSITINVTSSDAGDPLTLSVGTVAGVSNLTVSPSVSTSPAAFTVSGIVDYSLNGTTVFVPILAVSTSGTATGNFRIVVTPEPTLLGVVGVALAGARRRMK